MKKEASVGLLFRFGSNKTTRVILLTKGNGAFSKPEFEFSEFASHQFTVMPWQSISWHCSEISSKTSKKVGITKSKGASKLSSAFWFLNNLVYKTQTNKVSDTYLVTTGSTGKYYAGARALPRIRLPLVLAVIFIWVMGVAGTTVLYR